MRRWRGLERGDRWRKEAPEKYGIEKTNLRLPGWLNHAIGYENPDFQPFSIFREGDWFDGVDEGIGESDAIALIFESIPSHKDGGLLIFDHALKKWVVYASEARQVSAWLELYKGSKKSGSKINEPEDMHLTAEKIEIKLQNMDNNDKKILLEKLKNRIAYKQRLSIFLRPWARP